LFSDPQSIIYLSVGVIAIMMTAIVFRLALQKMRRKNAQP